VLAVDTNVVVRYLTADHPGQSARARTLIERAEVFIATTVLLETEWVLRSVYDHGAAEIVRAFRAFAGLPNVALEDPALADTALNWLEHGLDFADALHLAKARDCEALISFDRSLARAARRIGGSPVRAP
jgi:predicted nucleic acid-binding protein